MRWLDGINDAMGMNLGEFLEIRTGRPGMLQSVGSERVGHDWTTEQQQQHWNDPSVIYSKPTKFSRELFW